MTTYRLDIFRFGRLIGQLQSEAPWAKEAILDVVQRLPEKDGYSTTLLVAHDERRILETGPSGSRVISREPLFERDATQRPQIESTSMEYNR